jgi:hypothetical protein
MAAFCGRRAIILREIELQERMMLRTGFAMFVCVSSASATILHDESVSGDLPGDRLTPAVANFLPGLNDLIGTTVSFDRDYITATIPQGHQLTGIELISFGPTGSANRGFAGFEQGQTISTDPTSGSSMGLFGWIVFGAFDTGFNLLPDGLIPGEDLPAVPSVVPDAASAALGSTPVAIWIQETSAQRVDYGFRFTIAPIPEPATACVILGSALVLAGRRRG